MTSVTTTGGTTFGPDSSEVDDGEADVDPLHFDPGGNPDFPEGGCPSCDELDVLFVVDNSSTMAAAQRSLARASTQLVASLEVFRYGTAADVQVMVTTTDMGNPACTPFQPEGYAPAEGAPVSAGCNARIADFTSLTGAPSPWACTEVCPADVVPSDPFVWFSTTEEADNVGVPEADIDGDGVPDSGAAQALACLLPQGTNGCGYGSPLESMIQALNPAQPWNQGTRPFLREGAALAIVLVSDESDCSVQDFSLMEDESYFEISPDTGDAQPSSALCWNAGVTCDGPDGNGFYSDCATLDGPLHELDRYRDYLVDELSSHQGKSVAMAVLGGVPEVTAYGRDRPYAPTAGGLFELVYRDWQDGEYPAGDILPSEWADGIDAADKQFALGIGPGCTHDDPDDARDIQAVPSPRAFEVCAALDGDDLQRCCIDSICDDDPYPALHCVLSAAAPLAAPD